MNHPAPARLFAMLLTVLGLTLSTSAVALDIVFTDIGATPMTAQQLAAFEEAAAIWETRLSDPVEVQVNVKLVPLSASGAIASTLSAKTTHIWWQTVIQMLVDADSPDELGALSQLNGMQVPVLDMDGRRDSASVTLTTANAKALGLSTGRDTSYQPTPAHGADATISLNSDRLSQLDFDRSDGTPAGQFDVVSVVLHELGHALGFVSQVEMQQNNAGLPLPPMLQDIWRFTVSANAHHFDTESRLLMAGFAEYDDSVDSAELSHGTDAPDPDCPAVDDECDASHFRGSAGHAMDPTMPWATQLWPSAMDLHVLDYIGWDLGPLPLLTRDLQVEAVLAFDPAQWLQPPGVGGGYPAPLPMAPATLDFVPNLGLVMAVDFGQRHGEAVLGGKRTLLGHVALEAQHPVTATPYKAPAAGSGWESLDVDGEQQTQVPPSICSAAFNSDDAATGFTATLLGNACAPFDPHIGRFGGWRLPLCLQNRAYGDGDARDCAARMSLHLALPAAAAEASITAEALAGRQLLLDLDRDPGLEVFAAAELGMNDHDLDGRPDLQDNCPQVTNPYQQDQDRDGVGDACEAGVDLD